MARLAGIAKLESGAPATAVLARDWATHAHVSKVLPDVDGNWEASVPSGVYDITILGPVGYQPRCDGPIRASEI